MRETLHTLAALAALILLCLADFAGVNAAGPLSIPLGLAVLAAAAVTAVSMDRLLRPSPVR